MQQHHIRILCFIFGFSLLFSFSTLSAKNFPSIQHTILPQGLPPRPTLTPQLSDGSDDAGGRSADIRWTQAFSLAESAVDQSLLSIAVRGINVGNSKGRSDAILFYDPAVLRLLDAMPNRPIDWVRARDDTGGKVTLALGALASGEQAAIQVRFVILEKTNTIIHTIRDDRQDRANPLFLKLERLTDEPLDLVVQQIDTMITIAGRGYKPSEDLVLWGNTIQGAVIAIDESATASNDEQGSVFLTLPMPTQAVVSIVVQGKLSGVLGVAEIDVRQQ